MQKWVRLKKKQEPSVNSIPRNVHTSLLHVILKKKAESKFYETTKDRCLSGYDE